VVQVSPGLACGFFFGVFVVLANGVEVHGGGGQLDLEPFQVVHDNPRHGEVAKPLTVGGDDKPGRPFGAATGQGFLVGLRVGVPEPSLLVVGIADLPVAVQVVESSLESPQLFLLTDVEEELDYMRVVFREERSNEFNWW
jgi:hypothetical protein